MALLVLAPMAFIVLNAVAPAWLGQNSAASHSLLSGSLRQAACNSLLLGIGVAAMASTVALVLALLMEYYPPPLAGLWEALLYLPFLSAPYLLALGWSALALPDSIFSRHLGFLALPLYHFTFSLSGIAFITASHMMPLIYALLRGYLSGTGQRYEMAAQVHGLDRWNTFRFITLPRLMIPLAGGALLAFLAAIEEFGVPAMLGPYMGLSVLTTAIQSDLDVWPINLIEASRIGVLMLVIGVFAWSLYRRFDRGGGLDYSRLNQPSAKSHWAGWLAVLWALVAGVLPMLVLCLMALLRTETLGLHWNNFTLSNFEAVLQPGNTGYQALMTSVGLATSASFIALAIGSAIAFAQRSGRRSDEALDMVTTLLNALPGVVLAVAMVLFWNAWWNPLPLYGHRSLLLVAYVTVLLPFVLRYAHTAVARVEPGLLTAAKVHDVTGLLLAGRIVIPLMLPPLIGGFAIAFSFGLREFVTSVLLQPPGVDTVSTFIFNQVDQGNGGAAMAMAVVSLATSFAAVGLLRRLQHRRGSVQNGPQPAAG